MEFRLDQVAVGDVLEIVGELDHYIVEKIWLSQQGSYRWVEYEVRGRRSQQKLVIGVEYDDGEWEAVIYDGFPEAHEIHEAAHLPASVTWQAEVYRRTERGTCHIRLITAETQGEELSCRYADYEGPGGKELSIEIFGEQSGSEEALEIEVYSGRSIEANQVQIYAPISTEPRRGYIITTSSVHRSNSNSVTLSHQQLMIGGVALLAIIVALILLF